MRNLMKMIAITAITALLLFALITCAVADEKIYTSPVFTLPADRLERAEEILEQQEQQAGSEAEESETPEGAETPEEVPGEEPEDVDEDDADEDFEELGDEAAQLEESAKNQRRVIIKSSQGDIVTEGDLIRLTSELRGFSDDEKVEYQWQVDRGDGAGWVDVEGATKWKHEFVANAETIKYSWRLIVNVID